MSISNKLLPKAFAENAGSTYRYDIPDTNDTEFTNKATYDKGFPAVTMTDIAAGGIPPFGQDMNGVLCDLTTAIRYLQAGNLARYDASFATAIGGYLKNAVVSDLNANQYRSLVDNNTAELTDTSSWVQIDALEKGIGGTVSGNTNFTGALQKDGSDVVTKATALTDLTPYMLGAGQTWKDVKDSRSINVIYTNTGSKPIQVYVMVVTTGNVATGIEIDGTSLTFGWSLQSWVVTMNVIIPPMSTYKIIPNGVSSIYAWDELRGND